MYWIFLIIFIISVLIPDIFRTDVSFLSEARAEEIAIFLLGASAFILFLIKEKQIVFHKKEKEKDQKKIDQTVKDLVESYSYIGEVNRKMDILMNSALGFSNQTALSNTHEKETYASIVSAAKFLLKADYACLKFINIENEKTEKDFCLTEKRNLIKNSELTKIEEGINIKKLEKCLVVSSGQIVRGIRSFLIICEYDEAEENSPKNMEILKVFVSQALFLYSYARTQDVSEKNTNCQNPTCHC